MKKSRALAYYDGNHAALGRAIGVTRVTVHAWPPVIPLEPARALEIVTAGALQVDETLYPRLVLARQLVRKRGSKTNVETPVSNT